MEHDLADDLDDLICSGPLNVGGSNYEYLYKIGGAVFVVWISIAGLVYLVANYLIQTPPTTEVSSDISAETSVTKEESDESKSIVHQEVSYVTFSWAIP